MLDIKSFEQGAFHREVGDKVGGVDLQDSDTFLDLGGDDEVRAELELSWDHLGIKVHLEIQEFLLEFLPFNSILIHIRCLLEVLPDPSVHLLWLTLILFPQNLNGGTDPPP